MGIRSFRLVLVRVLLIMGWCLGRAQCWVDVSLFRCLRFLCVKLREEFESLEEVLAERGAWSVDGDDN